MTDHHHRYDVLLRRAMLVAFIALLFTLAVLAVEIIAAVASALGAATGVAIGELVFGPETTGALISKRIGIVLAGAALGIYFEACVRPKLWSRDDWKELAAMVIATWREIGRQRESEGE